MPVRRRRKYKPQKQIFITGGNFYGNSNHQSRLRADGLRVAGLSLGKALEGMARQPEMANTLRTNMILGCAITESTGIYSLVVALVLLFIF